jgi:hypothetical protein
VRRPALRRTVDERQHVTDCVCVASNEIAMWQQFVIEYMCFVWLAADNAKLGRRCRKKP